MGCRLSLFVLPKKLAKKVWLLKTYDEVHKTLGDLECIVCDFCTDAMLDVVGDMKRLTKSKLDVECDVSMGKMDKEKFMIFIDSIKFYAERQIKLCEKPTWTWQYIKPSDNPWLLCYSRDWISGYYMAWYIFKKMDWDNNFVYFSIG